MALTGVGYCSQGFMYTVRSSLQTYAVSGLVSVSLYYSVTKDICFGPKESSYLKRVFRPAGGNVSRLFENFLITRLTLLSLGVFSGVLDYLKARSYCILDFQENHQIDAVDLKSNNSPRPSFEEALATGVYKGYKTGLAFSILIIVEKTALDVISRRFGPPYITIGSPLMRVINEARVIAKHVLPLPIFFCSFVEGVLELVRPTKQEPN